MSTYSVLGSMLGAGDTVVKQTKTLFSWVILFGRRDRNKQINKNII